MNLGRSVPPPRTAALVLLASLLAPAVAPADVVAVGSETVVTVAQNSDYGLSDPAVAPYGSGFLVAWSTSFTRYGGGSQVIDWGGGIYARKIGPDGQPSGSRRTLLPEGHKIDLSPPSIATDAVGRYAVVWTSAPEHHPHIDQGLRQFSAAGAASAPIRVDRYPPTPSFFFPQDRGTVALGTAGRAFTVWPRPAGPPDATALLGQIFTSAGQPWVRPFPVTDRAASQSRPSLRTDRRGNSVLVYENQAPGGLRSVFLRLYRADGRPNGGDVRVSRPGRAAGGAALAVSPGGRFVVLWTEEGGTAAWARIFDPPYRPVGAAFRVNTPNIFYPTSPDVAIGQDGTLLVAWRSVDAEGHGLVFARALDPLGNPLGPPFRVDRDRPLGEFSPPLGRVAVAAGESGTFLATWLAYDADTSRYQVISRLLAPEGSPLATDS